MSLESIKANTAIYLIFVFIPFCALFSQEPTMQEEGELIAVNDLIGRGIDKTEAATLSDVLRSNLHNTGMFRVMERGEMDNILKEQGFQQSGACNEKGCMIEMGQLLGAKKLVAGSIGKVGSAYSINARIIDISSGEITNSVTHNYTGPIEDLLTREMNRVAYKLAGIEPQAEETEPEKVAESGAVDAKELEEVTVDESKRDKEGSRRGLVIGLTAGGLAVAGGVAALIMLDGDEEDKVGDPSDKDDPTTDLILTW